MPDSKPFTFNTAGTFYFVATYSGDSNNTGPVNSGCTAEPLTVSKAPTGTVTAIKQSGSTVTVVQPGTSVTDLATVSGQVGSIAPTGTVSFLFYSTVDCSGNSTAAGSPALASGIATVERRRAALGRQLLVQSDLQRRCELRLVDRRLRAADRSEPSRDPE